MSGSDCSLTAETATQHALFSAAAGSSHIFSQLQIIMRHAPTIPSSSTLFLSKVLFNCKGFEATIDCGIGKAIGYLY